VHVKNIQVFFKKHQADINPITAIAVLKNHDLKNKNLKKNLLNVSFVSNNQFLYFPVG